MAAKRMELRKMRQRNEVTLRKALSGESSHSTAQRPARLTVPQEFRLSGPQRVSSPESSAGAPLTSWPQSLRGPGGTADDGRPSPRTQASPRPLTVPAAPKLCTARQEAPRCQARFEQDAVIQHVKAHNLQSQARHQSNLATARSERHLAAMAQFRQQLDAWGEAETSESEARWRHTYAEAVARALLAAPQRVRDDELLSISSLASDGGACRDSVEEFEV